MRRPVLPTVYIARSILHNLVLSQDHVLRYYSQEANLTAISERGLRDPS